jgi:LPXTG-motif cell wall-anchored protein
VLQGLTITNGLAAGGPGGNIVVRPGANLTVQDSVVSNGGALSGAGIAADTGTLIVQRSEIINNTGTAIFGNGSTGDAISKTGGALSTLVISDSLIAGNLSTGGNNGALYTNGTATISNTTIAGNTSYNRTVDFEASGPNAIAVTLTHVTIAGNVGTGNLPPVGLFANAVAPATLSVVLEGSLLMDNRMAGVQKNCGTAGSGIAAITSNGRNLTDDLTCTGLVTPTDLSNNQATTLGALADNGGPTRTLALLAGSSAIDSAGSCGPVTPTDQRGVARPQGPGCDIGAFEVAVVVPPSTDSSTTSTTTTTTAAPTVDDPTTTSATVAPTTPTTGNGSGGVGATTLPPPPTFAGGTLPATGGHSSNGLWLAALVCSLGGLLVLAARRRTAA